VALPEESENHTDPVPGTVMPVSRAHSSLPSSLAALRMYPVMSEGLPMMPSDGTRKSPCACVSLLARTELLFASGKEVMALLRALNSCDGIFIKEQ